MSAFGAEGANLMSDPADTYRIAENDPMLWLENAECLRLSAQLSWDGMQKIMRRSPAEGDIRMRQLAYVHSFMLLTAHAFENLCRGISVARKEDWRLLIGDKGGHALKKHVSSITSLSTDESYLVERLEVYLLWAGRYPVPKTAEAYGEAVRNQWRNVRGVDLENTDGLFSRLRGVLKSDAAKYRSTA
jgi:hypothetical protein